MQKSPDYTIELWYRTSSARGLGNKCWPRMLCRGWTWVDPTIKLLRSADFCKSWVNYVNPGVWQSNRRRKKIPKKSLKKLNMNWSDLSTLDSTNSLPQIHCPRGTNKTSPWSQDSCSCPHKETQTWACPPQPCDPRPAPAGQPPPPWTARSSSPGRCPCCWTLLGSPRPPHSSQRAPSAWPRALPWCRRGCWQTRWLYPCCCRGKLWGCPCGWWTPFPLGLLGHRAFHSSQRAQSLLPCPLQGALHHPLPYASCWAALIDGIESLVRKNFPISFPIETPLPSIPTVEFGTNTTSSLKDTK